MVDRADYGGGYENGGHSGGGHLPEEVPPGQVKVAEDDQVGEVGPGEQERASVGKEDATV